MFPWKWRQVIGVHMRMTSRNWCFYLLILLYKSIFKKKTLFHFTVPADLNTTCYTYTIKIIWMYGTPELSCYAHIKSISSSTHSYSNRALNVVSYSLFCKPHSDPHLRHAWFFFSGIQMHDELKGRSWLRSNISLFLKIIYHFSLV